MGVSAGRRGASGEVYALGESCKSLGRGGRYWWLRVFVADRGSGYRVWEAPSRYAPKVTPGGSVDRKALGWLVSEPASQFDMRG
jgi:hypothetical protein